MTRVMLIGAELANTTSGQARFLFNIALGLSRSGISVSVLLYGKAGERGNLLRRAGIDVVTLGHNVDSHLGQLSRVTRLNRAGRVLATRANQMEPCDWYIVLADELVSSARHKAGGRWAYLSNGDMALLLFNRAFVGADRIARGLISLGAADLIRSHSRDAECYDLLLANSEFTRHLMTYLYGVPFQGVVHPPVDVETFHPRASAAKNDYVLALARNNSEQSLSLLEELARELPLRVIGEARVAGASTSHGISDSALAELYSNAAFLAFPTLSEPFGYAVAEALCCGTPALVFDAGGPSELVRKSGGGWTVRNKTEFVELARRVFGEGVNPTLRKMAASASKYLSIEASTVALVTALQGAG